MRAAIYTRVSSDPKGIGRSVSEQEADCRLVAERENWQVVRVFTDQDRSASRYAKLSRPAYKQLVAFVSEGGCDALVTWEASRFQRDLEDYLKLRELCRKAGVLWSYSGRTYDLSRTDDRFTTGLDALLSERESDITRDRILRAVRANAAQGRPHGRLLYGYRREYDATSGVLLRQVIREDQASLIQEAAKRFLAGETPYAIAKDFNTRGLVAPRGGEWNLTLIRRLLTNPHYNGQRVHLGKVIRQAEWEPILDDSTFHQCVAKFSDPTRQKYRDSRIKYLLTGIAECGVCGTKLKYGKPRGYASYICPKGFCVARKLDTVENLVTKLIIARLSLPDAKGLFAHHDDSTAPILSAIVEKRARLEEFHDAAAKGEVSAVGLARIEATLIPEIEALERRVRPDLPTAVYDLVRNPAEVWEALPITAKREVIRSLMRIRILKTQRGTRTLDPATVVIDWRRWPGADLAVPA